MQLHIFNPPLQVPNQNPNILGHSQVTLQASVACVSLVVQTDSSWFLDSRATNHLTSVAPLQQVITVYTGPGKSLIGNGYSLHILAIRSFIISIDSRHLILNNMLYTHCVTKKNYFLCFSSPRKIRCTLNFTHFTVWLRIPSLTRFCWKDLSRVDYISLIFTTLLLRICVNTLCTNITTNFVMCLILP